MTHDECYGDITPNLWKASQITRDTGASLGFRCPIILMEASQGDYRRTGLIALAAFSLVAVVVMVSLIVRPKTGFEWEQARAEAMNPKWLSVEITTADNRREYREGQPSLSLHVFRARFDIRIRSR